MAKYIVAKKMSTIALTGGRAFFVPAGFISRRRIMSDPIPIKGKAKRGKTDIYDELDTKLRDIFTVADLLGEVDSDNIGPEQLNATGYCLTRMIEDAQKLSSELYEKGGAK